MQKIFVINWKRKEDTTNSSMYSDMFIDKASKDHKVVELFLKGSEGDFKNPDNINQIGPFDTKAYNFFGKETMESAFNKYILDKIYSFVDATIVIFDPRVIEFIPPIIMKECRVIFIQAYEHHFAQHSKLIDRLRKRTFLRDNIVLTVTSCEDDNYLFKSLFDHKTINMKSNISSKNSVKKRKKSSNRYVMFHGDYEKMPWRKIKKLLAGMNKKGIVYSNSKSFKKDLEKHGDDRLKFVKNEKEFLKFAKDAVLLNPMETNNIGPSIVQSLSLGIPLMLFEESDYNTELIGDNLRGLYVDLKNPDYIEIKTIIKKTVWETMVDNCLELADLKYSKDVFDYSVDKILRRAER